MDLDELRGVQQEERNMDSLVDLNDSFYREVGGYIEELKKNHRGFDDRYSHDAQKVEDEIVSAREVIESIQERRVGKIVNLASLKANGINIEESKMTVEEREMFDSIVADIRDGRGEIRDVLSGEIDSPPINEEESGETDGEEEDDYLTVRAEKELPTFMGVDGKEYNLETDDVAEIPRENAEVLLEKEAVSRIE